MTTGKKVRRVRRPQGSTTPPKADQSATPVIKIPVPSKSFTSSTEEELRQEYTYVLQDLRRVFTLAAAMFILLILINLFLL
ncbi:MAG: hypothetical protein KA314_15170 [Chloroflexi bacterium]|nr:hypothetical protein [Chloroflexota bacterium]MBP8057177.1 hypothetical protein [Chloroflexota bacterium]